MNFYLKSSVKAKSNVTLKKSFALALLKFHSYRVYLEIFKHVLK